MQKLLLIAAPANILSVFISQAFMKYLNEVEQFRIFSCLISNVGFSDRGGRDNYYVLTFQTETLQCEKVQRTA